MFLIMGALLGLLGLVLLGISGNQRAGKGGRNGTRWLTWIACFTLLFAVMIFVDGEPLFDELVWIIVRR